MASIIGIASFSKIDSGNNSTFTAVIPSGGQAGDIICACIASSDSLNPSSLSATGWSIRTQNYTTVSGGNSPHMALLTRPWTGSDPVIFNIGADIRDDHGLTFLVRGADVDNPIGQISAAYLATQTTGYTAQGVSTTLPDSLLVSFCASKVGAASYADDTNGPAGMTVLYNRRSRINSVSLRIGVAYENRPTTGATGARTWTAFNDAGSYTAAFNFVINPAAATESITSVNGGAGITAGSTGNTAQLDGYSGTTGWSAMHGPLAMTNLSYNETTKVLTFDCPAYADGATWPLFDATANFVVSNGTQSATLNNVPTNPPAGWAQVTISSPVTTDATYIGSVSDVSNHEIVNRTRIGESALLPAEGLVIYPDSGISIPKDLAGLHQMYKRNLTSGVITLLSLTLNDASQIVTSPVMPADASVTVDVGTLTLGTFAATSGSSPITYTLGGTNASLFDINSTTAAVTFKAAAVAGTGSITVTATNAGGSDSQVINYTVAVPNSNPVVSLVATKTFTAQITATDPDGDTLSYSVTTQGAYGTATVNSSGLITYTAGGSFAGRDKFVVTVSDGKGGTATVRVNVSGGSSVSGSLSIGIGIGIGL